MAGYEGFKREAVTINGVDVVYYTAGEGEPVLFLHGGGTFHGIEFARPWAKTFRTILPWHPGFAESGDDPSMNEFQDYVLHYIEFLDALKIDRVHLVGFSMGGYIAVQIASQFPDRVKKLTMIAPAGMHDKEHPAADILAMPGEELVGRLAHNFEVLKPWLPTGHDPAFIEARIRESVTLARLLWEHPWRRKFMRYIHRATMPTLIVWGENDRIIPVEHAKHWQKAMPHAEVKTFKDAGHLVLDEKAEATNAVRDFLAA